MGKNKQAKEKKFDRNVEISAPILDPEIIKAIHTPPKGQRLNMQHGGFKALLSDLNSQDSTDELTPLNDNHVPSYIGISCAVSGYSNFSPYSTGRNKSPALVTSTTYKTTTRSQTNSPVAPTQRNADHQNNHQHHHHHHQVNHITIDKNNIHSVDEERRELTEKLTASAAEHRRSPSPCIPPTEDDRHHGAYVGARYCPLPPPSKVVNKHIPLLGIDDEQNPDEMTDEDANKVEQRIASIYGDNFVEDWRESMTHKTKKENTVEASQAEQQETLKKSPKDLVTLRPTPVAADSGAGEGSQRQQVVDIQVSPNAKVLAGVDKQFLHKLLTDENPPVPQSPSHSPQPKVTATTKIEKQDLPLAKSAIEEEKQQQSHSPPPPPKSPDSGKNQSITEETIKIPAASQSGDEAHIEYEIRANSPVDNESSPVKVSIRSQELQDIVEDDQQSLEDEHLIVGQQKLVSFSPEQPVVVDGVAIVDEQSKALVVEDIVDTTTAKLSIDNNNRSGSSGSKDGRYYLGLLDEKTSFILEQASKAEEILRIQEAELDEDTVGRIRSAIGKANLLVNKKFNQFRELCEANINKTSDAQFATLNDDLAGFWDMLSIQVSDIQKSFETLWQTKESNWSSDTTINADNIIGAQVEEESNKDNSGNSKGNKSKLSAQKDQERRERLQEHINQMKQNQAAKSSSENLLDEVSETIKFEESPKMKFEVGLEDKQAVVEDQDVEGLLVNISNETVAQQPASDDGSVNADKPSTDLLDL